jgi:carbon storage regulator
MPPADFLFTEETMLVLSRKLGEKICIGNDVMIVVTGFDRGKVRIGIKAPDSVQILRHEIAPQEVLAKLDGGKHDPGE